MNDRLALRPDLSRCALEDRILPTIEFGMFPNPFLQVNSATNQIFVPGTSTSSAGISAGGSLNSNSISLSGLGSNPPGPQWYFIMVGGNASGVSSGSITGGSLSIYSFASFKFLPTGAMVHTISNLISTANPSQGVGADASNGAGDTSGSTSSAPASVANFGATFSSGYGFALGSANNYGMFSGTGATTTLGSVPVHTYEGGGDVQDVVPGGQNGANPGVDPAPMVVPTVVPGLQGPASKLYDNLLGKNPGQMGPMQMGPGTGIGSSPSPSSGSGQGQAVP